MKTFIPAFYVLLILSGLLSSCSDNKKVKQELNSSEKIDVYQSCDQFWNVYNPDDSAKVLLIQSEIESGRNLNNENVNLLNAIIKELQEERSMDNLPLTFEYPLFPIHRLKKNQIGVLGYAISKEINGQWEDFSREDQLLKKDFGYQSIDSMGVLVSFPKVYNKLYPESKPSVYWYSNRKKGRSTLTQMCYMGGDCLSYFHYTIELSSADEKENIAFGSPFSLDLDFKPRPDLDKKFQTQFVKNCVDCPINYTDQKIIAQLKGTNIFFTQADSWPINDKLDSPSRSMVLLTKEGNIITLWNSELDLFGCGCL